MQFTHEWFKTAAPLLKVLASTLSLVLPVAASSAELFIEQTTYNSLENYLNFGKEVIDSTLGSDNKAVEWMKSGTPGGLSYGTAIRAQGAILRELHALLKARDPSFGGLVRVMNKRQEFLWVHESFASEY